VNKAIMGIDCGTSKIAVILIDPEKRAVLDIRSAEHHAYIHGDRATRREQDVSQISTVFRKLITDVLLSANVQILSIGLTGQTHGILGLDGKAKPLTNYVTWEDGRGEEEIQPGRTLLDKIREHVDPSRPMATGYGVVTLYDWIRHGLPSGIAKVCSLVDYLGVLLTENSIPTTDFTMAETMGMLDVPNSCWATDLLAALNIPSSLLPNLSPPTTVTGALRASWLLELSENRDVPVCVTLGDNQAGYLAAVRKPYQSILINIGTGSQISVAIPPGAAKEILSSIDGYDVTLRPFVESGYIVAGSSLSGGAAYRALQRFFAAAGHSLFNVEKPPDLYAKMQELAEKAGNSQGLHLEPFLSGSRSNPEVRGRLEGLSYENLLPGPLIYAMQEGIIRILKDMVDPRLTGKRKYLVGSGNGFRRNTLLRKIASDIFNIELQIPRIPEEAATGAALNGAVAAGVYSNFEEAREIIQYGSADK